MKLWKGAEGDGLADVVCRGYDQILEDLATRNEKGYLLEAAHRVGRQIRWLA